MVSLLLNCSIVFSIALIIRDPLDIEWYDHYDLGSEFYFDGNSLRDYENEMGVRQVLYDETSDYEEEMSDPLLGAFFSTMRFLIYPDEVILVIYER